MGAEGGATREHVKGPILVAAAAVYYAGQLLPLPGVDHEALAGAVAQGGSVGLTFAEAIPALGLIGPSAATLVLVQLVLHLGGVYDRPWARRVGAAVYLALTAVQGLLLAFWAESLAELLYYDVVPEVGWAFRLQVALGVTAGGAILWWAFSKVDRTGRAHGALFLALLAGLQHALGEAYRAGADAATGHLGPGLALARLALPFAFVLVGLVVVMRPRRWPARVVGPVPLRSGWDAIALPALFAVPIVTFGAGVDGTTVDAPNLLVPISGVTGLGVGIVVAVLWLRGDAKPGRRARGPAAVAIFAFACSAFLMLAAFAGGDGFARVLAPGPLAGEASFTLVLEAEERFADGDADAMVQRLEALGAAARATDRGPSRITLAVERASSVEAVLDALRPRRLEMRFARRLEEDLYFGTIGVSPVRYPETGAVRGWTAACTEWGYFAGSPPPHCEVALERPEVEGEPCTVHCLEHEAAITGADVADAHVAMDPQTNQPIVLIELRARAAATFGDVTGAHLRDVLAILVDGEVVSAPVVVSRIDGGHAQITLGWSEDAAAQLREASALAAALRPGAQIASDFTVAEQR